MVEILGGTERVLTAEEARKRTGSTLLRLKEAFSRAVCTQSQTSHRLFMDLKGEEECGTAEDLALWLRDLGYHVVVESRDDMLNTLGRVKVLNLFVSWGSEV